MRAIAPSGRNLFQLDTAFQTEPECSHRREGFHEVFQEFSWTYEPGPAQVQ